MVMRAFLLEEGVNLMMINNIENFIKRKSISITTIYQIDPNLNSKVSALLPGLVNLANTIPAMQALNKILFLPTNHRVHSSPE